jgi:hypothetical protein
VNSSGKPDAGNLPVRFDEGDGDGKSRTIPTPQKGNWESIQPMEKINDNPNIHFIGVEGFTHFSEIYPVLEVISKHIISNDLNITSGEINRK